MSYNLFLYDNHSIEMSKYFKLISHLKVKKAVNIYHDIVPLLVLAGNHGLSSDLYHIICSITLEN